MIDTLVRRRDFLSVSRSRLKQVTRGFVLLARKRGAEAAGGARIGYTVTRKIGKAVVRNRIKRRFRELARRILDPKAHADYDFLMIARHQAAREGFGDLERQMRHAIEHVTADRPDHRGKPSAGRRRPSRRRSGGAE